MSKPYETTIGLEVHVQLKTTTKAFCGCPTVFGAPANSQVCPVCLGLPGALPVFNTRAFELGTRAALALHCQISPRIKFDRKNYFYPDVPKNYQISQFDQPLSFDGWLDIEREGQATQRVGITRAHLEEDAGKLMHDVVPDGSLVDYNRAGMPLLEIVSEPDMRGPDEAYGYLTILKSILQYVGVSDCDMEKGSLRCDANVSIRPAGQVELGAKVEIKNLNSFRAVRASLRHEEERQAEVLDRDEVVLQETRLWDTDRNVTVSMRSKEQASDYRYFPEPDLVPFQVDAAVVERIRATLPELPQARAKRFSTAYQLSAYDISVLTSERALADMFEATVRAGASAKSVANWLMGDVLSNLNERHLLVRDATMNVEHLAALIALVESEAISRPAGKEVLTDMLGTGRHPQEIVDAKGLGQVSDTGALEAIVTQVIAAQEKSVADYRGGKTTALQFLVGQCMRASKGKANPNLVADVLRQRLDT